MRSDALPGATLNANEVTYSIHNEARTSGPGNLRRVTRSRTRLCSGKIVDLVGDFICHCIIHDRSRFGMRLAIDRPHSLPARFLILDDTSGTICLGRAVWRRDTSVGVLLFPNAPIQLSKAALNALRTRYYGIPRR